MDEQAIDWVSSDRYRVPVAFDEVSGRRVRPSNAMSHGKYQCVFCGGRVVLKKAPNGIMFFCHLPGAETCNGESPHSKAEHILKDIIDGARKGLVRLLVKVGRQKPLRVPLGTRTAIEQTDDENGRRYDVVIYDGESAVAVFEIRYKHPVPHEKRQEIHVPWWEIEARTIGRLILEDGMERLREGLPWGRDVVLDALACGVGGGPRSDGDEPGALPNPPSARLLRALRHGLMKSGVVVGVAQRCARHGEVKHTWTARPGGYDVGAVDLEGRGAHIEIRRNNETVILIFVAGHDSMVPRTGERILRSFDDPLIVCTETALMAGISGGRYRQMSIHLVW